MSEIIEQDATIRTHAKRLKKDGILQGAMTERLGSHAFHASSKRTWSLPLPVQPWLRILQLYL